MERSSSVNRIHNRHARARCAADARIGLGLAGLLLASVSAAAFWSGMHPYAAAVVGVFALGFLGASID